MNEEMTIAAIQAKFATWGKLAADRTVGVAVTPMTLDESKVFMQLALMEQQGRALPEEFFRSLDYQLISKRAEFAGLSLSPCAGGMVAVLAKGNPGCMVMYVYALKSLQQGQEKPPMITMAMLAEFFPVGFYTEKRLSKMWDAQKVGGSNLLDCLSAEVLNVT